MSSRRRVARALALAAFALAASCGGASNAGKAPGARGKEPAWEDAFDPTADLVAVVKPEALRHDPVYGPLLRRASSLAAAHSAAVAETRLVEVIEGADEVVFGAWLSRDDGGGVAADRAVTEGHVRPGDVEMVIRGVSAAVDAARVVDAAGHPLWRLAQNHPADGTTTIVPEYVHDAADGQTSLFVLPGRVWFVATGEMRTRAGDAFEHPFGRPKMNRDDPALVTLDLAGEPLVHAVPRLHERGQLAAIGHHLRKVSVGLDPGAIGTVTAELRYTDEDAAAVAELVMKRVVEVTRRGHEGRFAWLASAEVERAEPSVVTVHAALPKSLLHSLAAADDAPLPDHAWPSPGDGSD